MSSLTITIIQPDIAWENKKVNLEMFSEKIQSIKEKTEVVILPEMFSTGFSMNTEKLAEKMEGETVQWMRNVSSAKKIILTGSLIIEERGKYFNRLIWMLPDGNYGYYNKRHLFAFANEDKCFTAGSKRMIASVKGWRLNLQICYDLRFPVWARQAPSLNLSAGSGGRMQAKVERQNFEYDLLVYVANWPKRRSAVWKTLLQARAIENQCYVVGVNRIGKDGEKITYSGDSMIVDPLGKILYQKTNQEDVFTHTLEKEKLNEVRDKFPFWKEADEFKL